MLIRDGTSPGRYSGAQMDGRLGWRPAHTDTAAMRITITTMTIHATVLSTGDFFRGSSRRLCWPSNCWPWIISGE